MTRERLDGAYAYCQDMLRNEDKDRYLADLFLPATKRPYVHVLQAFFVEIERVRESVTEPMLGEIRLQWWRDQLTTDAAEPGQPVALALEDTIERFSLPRQPLIAMIEARTFDLYDDPMPDEAALEAYCDATSSALFELVALVLAEPDSRATLPDSPVRMHDRALPDACRAAGRACAYARLIRALARHSAHNRVYLPATLLARHGAASADLLAGRATPALLAAIADWRAAARRHLALLWKNLAALPREVRPAFLPAALVEGCLRATEKPGYDPFAGQAEVPQWRRQWALWRASRRL